MSRNYVALKAHFVSLLVTLLCAAIFTLAVFMLCKVLEFALPFFLVTGGSATTVLLWAIVYLAVAISGRLRRDSLMPPEEICFDLEEGEPRYLGAFIKEQCARRKLIAPEVIVSESYTFGVDSTAASSSKIWHRGVIIINRFMLHYFPQKEVVAVVAHELRHQRAASQLFGIALHLLKPTIMPIWFLSTLLVVAILALTGGSTGVALVLAVSLGLWLFMCWIIDSAIGLCQFFNEFKVDVLSAKDTGDHSSLVHALNRMESMKDSMRTRLEEVSQMFRAEMHAELGVVNLERRRSMRNTILDWILATMMFVRRLYFWSHILKYNTHPSDAKRAFLLTWVFGPIDPQRDPPDEDWGLPELPIPPFSGPGMIVVEIEVRE